MVSANSRQASEGKLKSGCSVAILRPFVGIVLCSLGSLHAEYLRCLVFKHSENTDVYQEDSFATSLKLATEDLTGASQNTNFSKKQDILSFAAVFDALDCLHSAPETSSHRSRTPACHKIGSRRILPPTTPARNRTRTVSGTI